MKKALLLSLAMLSSSAPILAEEKEDIHPCTKFARDKISMVKDAIKMAPLTLAGAEWWHVGGLAFIEWFDALTQYQTKRHRDSDTTMSTIINTLTNHWFQVTAALAAGYLTQEEADDKFKMLGAALGAVYVCDGLALTLDQVDKAA